MTARARLVPEAGASTAEYAMTMLVACAFAGVLMGIIKSNPIKTLLLGTIQKALNIG
ncbi:DUF4244 domain-containing protein [Kineosporia babensis]|uniref:DUF4244 domain-containing protein n=1 Tax=Kineosporia babensis TaxID=499548 RepID=A0A9X1NCZ3_9ACTN|nr:DUF4244 domain-containing protein [Kineosporia babensis]MCD5312697.1 DUF4244 domain-containing protein [Kineosporia babensis]